MKTWWITAAVAAGCAMTSRTTADLPRCPEAPLPIAHLESYIELELPATRWVEMVFDAGEWRPSGHIAMPHHHATRLELTNVADFPALAHRRGERLRFTVEITSRAIDKVAGRQQWRVTFRARIIAACIPHQGSMEAGQR
jgi:hypothetical protein